MANYQSTHTGSQIDSAISEAVKTGYGVCSSSSSPYAVTISNTNFAPETGAKVVVKFTNAVTAGAKLNINSKGAAAIYYNNAAIIDDVIKAGQLVTLVYDGTNYNVVSGGMSATYDSTNQTLKLF